ncbi:transporter substrate-binding domain-containing protein [Alkaliphilus peptidifermentans]|uniref:histidine kinase n=1 Tax=Alkaliphilus peptidifermentans DSM 18978 TaxID=1120976 RepID=A0A1G5L6E6_9FIRM|nr:transporter substrate-binding domain-containing protein [Alkaliphilus peptidifermentans]SCZ07918.1 polar amino acid transport system substrate-binding protein [Alkaliphilus peptidifermentans DSM 18978]
MSIKKIIIYLVFFLLVCSFSIVVDALPIQTIRIAGDDNYPPYEYLDEKGIYKGFNVDIMRAIAIELGIEIEIIPMPWYQAIEALEKGEVDAIQGMTYSLQRTEKFDFSDVLVVNSQAIFVLKETNYIAELQDLREVTVAYQAGDISEEIVSSIEGIMPIVKNNQEESMEALLKGEVEAAIGNRHTGLYILQRDRHFQEIKIVGEPLHATEYMAATIKGNTEVLKLLNKGIEGIKRNGTYDKIYRKWFGETFLDKTAIWRKMLLITMLILLMTIIGATFTINWNRKLKKEVFKRTYELDKTNRILQERKHQLEHSNRLRGKILENIFSGIITFNSDQRVSAFNRAAEKILDKEVKVDREWKQLGLDKLLSSAALNKVMEGEIWSENLEWHREGSRKVYVECNLIPIKDKDYEMEGFVLLLRDYSEEKYLRDIVYHTDKMKSLGRLVAGLAHEIRNPLTAIKTFIDLLPNKFYSQDYREKVIEVVPKEIDRIDHLVTLLLDYARPKAGVHQSTSLRSLINEIRDLLSIHLKQKKIEFIYEINDITLWCDEQQIQQVLVNLILNSIEAIGEKGKIVLSARIEKDEAVIQIIDNGCGIPEEALNNIFDPFFTLKTKGYGLGLAISYQLIEDNKGRIEFSSKVGEGTIANLHLPIAKEVDNNAQHTYY